MLRLVHKASQRQHDGTCRCFSAYQCVALLMSLFAPWLFRMMNGVATFLLIFVVPVLFHMLDAFCCMLSRHYFRHYSGYWHILCLTHVFYVFSDGAIQTDIRRYEFGPVKLAVLELLYFIRICLEYAHIIRLTALVCGVRAFSPLTNRAVWKFQVLMHYCGVMSWFKADWVRIIGFFLLVEIFERTYIFFSAGANYLALVVLIFQYQAVCGIGWILTVVYMVFSLLRMKHQHYRLYEKAIQCMMLFNVVETKLLGPLNQRERIQRLITFYQNIFRLGKLFVCQKGGYDKQDSVQLANLQVHCQKNLPLIAKNRLFKRPIRLSEDLLLSRKRDAQFQRIYEMVEGNQWLQNFVQQFTIGDDDLLQYIVCKYSLKQYCRRISHVQQALDGFVFKAVQLMAIDEQQREQLFDKYFSMPHAEKYQRSCISKFTYFSKPGISNDGNEYGFFLYNVDSAFRSTAFYDMLYNIFQCSGKHLNFDIYYKIFNKKSVYIDIQKFLHITDARLFSIFDLHRKVRFANRVLQICVPFSNAFCGTYDERAAESITNHEAEQFMYLPRGYLYFEAFNQLSQKQQLRIVDVDTYANKFQRFQPEVISGIQAYKSSQNQYTPACKRILQSNEQIISRLFNNLIFGAVQLNNVGMSSFVSQYEILAQANDGAGSHQLFQCVGIPQSILNSFSIYQFYEFLFKIVHVDTSQNLINTFFVNEYQRFISMVKGYWSYVSQIQQDQLRNTVLIQGAQLMLEQYRMIIRKLMKIKRYNNDPCIIQLIHQIAQRFRFDERFYRNVHFQYKTVKKLQTTNAASQADASASGSEMTTQRTTPNVLSQRGSNFERITCQSKNRGFAISRSYRQFNGKLSQFFLHFRLYAQKNKRTYEYAFTTVGVLLILASVTLIIVSYVKQNGQEKSMGSLVRQYFEQLYAYSPYTVKYIGNTDNFLSVKKENYGQFNTIQSSRQPDRESYFYHTCVPENSIAVPSSKADFQYVSDYTEYQIEKLIEIYSNQTAFKKSVDGQLVSLFTSKFEFTYQQIFGYIYLHSLNYATQNLDCNVLYYIIFFVLSALMLSKTMFAMYLLSQFSRLFEKYSLADMQKFLQFYYKSIKNTFFQLKSRVSTRINSRLMSKCHSKDTSISNSQLFDLPTKKIGQPASQQTRYQQFCYFIFYAVLVIIVIMAQFKMKQLAFLEYDVDQQLTVSIGEVKQFLAKNSQIFVHYQDGINYILTDKTIVLEEKQLLQNVQNDMYYFWNIPQLDMLQGNKHFVGQFRSFFMPSYVLSGTDHYIDTQIGKQQLKENTYMVKEYNIIGEQIFYYLKVGLQKHEYAKQRQDGMPTIKRFRYSADDDIFQNSRLIKIFSFYNSSECEDLQYRLGNNLIGDDESDLMLEAATLRLGAQCIIRSAEFHKLMDTHSKLSQTLLEDLYDFIDQKAANNSFMSTYLNPSVLTTVFQLVEILPSQYVINISILSVVLSFFLIVLVVQRKKYGSQQPQSEHPHLAQIGFIFNGLYYSSITIISILLVQAIVLFIFYTKLEVNTQKYLHTIRKIIDFNIINAKFISNSYGKDDIDIGWLIYGTETPAHFDTTIAREFGLEEYLLYRLNNRDRINRFYNSTMRSGGYLSMLQFSYYKYGLQYLSSIYKYLTQAEQFRRAELGQHVLRAQLNFYRFVEAYTLNLARFQRQLTSFNFFDLWIPLMTYCNLAFALIMALTVVFTAFANITSKYPVSGGNATIVPKAVFKCNLEQLGIGNFARSNFIFTDKQILARALLQFVPLLLILLEIVLQQIIQQAYYKKRKDHMLPWSFFDDLVSDLEISQAQVQKQEEASIVFSTSYKQIINIIRAHLSHFVHGYAKYGVETLISSPESHISSSLMRSENLPYLATNYAYVIHQKQFFNMIPPMYYEKRLSASDSAIWLLSSFEKLMLCEDAEKKKAVLDEIKKFSFAKTFASEPPANARIICFVSTVVLVIVGVIVDCFYGLHAYLRIIQRGVEQMIRGVIKSQESYS